jgi:F-type H+-transporting ATPase subunit a
MNWLIIFPIFFFICNLNFNVTKNKILHIIIIWAIKKETSPILSLKNFNSIELILISLFFSIILLNLISILPFVFTLNSHIVITFPTGLIWWLRIIIYGWIKRRKTMIMHAIPTGTPIILINFIILIEIISNFIRPLTLSIRLRANIIAGHLLINLLGSIKINSYSFFFNISTMVVLSMLELAVSIIQAYVFIILLTLYST